MRVLKNLSMKWKTWQLIVIVLLVSGCAEIRGWKFTPNTYSQPPQPMVQKSVVVPPFRDSRPDENSNKLGLYLIPLMPFGWADMSAPETFNPFIKFKPTEDLARSAVQELQASGLFKEVFYSERPSTEGDLVLVGEVKSTQLNQKIISYGLSVYASLFWLIGLPAGTVQNDLIVKLSLEEKATKATVWSKEFTRSYDAWSWLYSMKSFFEFDNLYRDLLKSAVEDMKGVIGKGVLQKGG